MAEQALEPPTGRFLPAVTGALDVIGERLDAG